MGRGMGCDEGEIQVPKRLRKKTRRCRFCHKEAVTFDPGFLCWICANCGEVDRRGS